MQRLETKTNMVSWRLLTDGTTVLWMDSTQSMPIPVGDGATPEFLKLSVTDSPIRLADEMEELGLWEFAVRFVPMTASQVAVCQMKSQIAIA